MRRATWCVLPPVLLLALTDWRGLSGSVTVSLRGAAAAGAASSRSSVSLAAAAAPPVTRPFSSIKYDGVPLGGVKFLVPTGGISAAAAESAVNSTAANAGRQNNLRIVARSPSPDVPAASIMHNPAAGETRRAGAATEQAMQFGDPPPVLTWRGLYLGLDGRLDREAFWIWGFVPWILVAWFFTLLIRSVFGEETQIVGIGLSLLSLVFAPVIVKRLHDRNRTGWLVLLCCLPVVYAVAVPMLATGDIRRDYVLFARSLLLNGLWAWVVIYECAISRGTAGPNKYGPVPLRFGL